MSVRPIASRRTLAPAPTRGTISPRWFFGGLLGFTAMLACFLPFAAMAFGFFCVSLGVAGWLVGIQNRRRQAEISARRGGESICTFVRGFDYRRMDTRVLRAVFEELQPLIDFPLRADDQLEADLHLDGETWTGTLLQSSLTGQVALCRIPSATLIMARSTP